MGAVWDSAASHWGDLFWGGGEGWSAACVSAKLFQGGGFGEGAAGRGGSVPPIQHGQLLPQLPVQLLEHRLRSVEFLLSLRGSGGGEVMGVRGG